MYFTRFIWECENFEVYLQRSLTRGVPQNRPGAEIIPCELDAVSTDERTCSWHFFNFFFSRLPEYSSIQVEIMKIFINRTSVESGDAVTLAELLSQNELDRPGIAVAVDNKVIRRDLWAEFPLNEGMKITVIHAVCGG